MIAPMIIQLRIDTNVNVVLAPALLDKIITKHMQSLNEPDLEFTWLDAFRSLTLIFQDAHESIVCNNSVIIWDTLVNECFEKLSREEECPTV